MSDIDAIRCARNAMVAHDEHRYLPGRGRVWADAYKHLGVMLERLKSEDRPSVTDDEWHGIIPLTHV